MERGHLSGDRGLSGLGAADDFGGTTRGQVLQVDAGLGEASEHAVTRDDDFFGGAWVAAEAETEGPGAFMYLGTIGHAAVLAVVEHDEVEHRRILERTTHDLVVLHAGGGVSHSDDARFFERANRREGLAFVALGQGAGGQDAYRSVAVAEFTDELNRANIVRRREAVGHDDHGRETTGGRGEGAGADALAGAATRFTEAAVEVNEAGGEDEPGGVDDLGTGLVGLRQLVDEATVLGEDLAAGVVAADGRVDHAGAADPEGSVFVGVHRAMAPVQR